LFSAFANKFSLSFVIAFFALFSLGKHVCSINELLDMNTGNVVIARELLRVESLSTSRRSSNEYLNGVKCSEKVKFFVKF